MPEIYIQIVLAFQVILNRALLLHDLHNECIKFRQYFNRICDSPVIFHYDVTSLFFGPGTY